MFSEEVLAFFEVIMLPSDQPFVVVGPPNKKSIWCALSRPFVCRIIAELF